MLETKTIQERNCILAYRNNCPIKTTSETHTILALPVLNSRNLQQSMSLFLGQGVGETIKVRCGHTGCQRNEAEISTTIQNLPLALIIQLKRTVPNPRCQTQMMKLNNKIDIPIIYKPKSTGPSYILTGALQQKGKEAGSGHYVSFTWNIKHKYFTLADDDHNLMTQSFERANHSLKGSYMFIYTCQEGEEEANSMTDDALSSPEKKKSRKEEFAEDEEEFSEDD